MRREYACWIISGTLALVGGMDSLVPNTAVQANDAKCGAACHQAAEATDFIFTAYGRR